jgi:hypothetical protein
VIDVLIVLPLFLISLIRVAEVALAVFLFTEQKGAADSASCERGLSAAKRLEYVENEKNYENSGYKGHGCYRYVLQDSPIKYLSPVEGAERQ